MNIKDLTKEQRLELNKYLKNMMIARQNKSEIPKKPAFCLPKCKCPYCGKYLVIEDNKSVKAIVDGKIAEGGTTPK